MPQTYIQFKTYKDTSYIMKTYMTHFYFNYYKKMDTYHQESELHQKFACTNKFSWSYTLSRFFPQYVFPSVFSENYFNTILRALMKYHVISLLHFLSLSTIKIIFIKKVVISSLSVFHFLCENNTFGGTSNKGEIGKILFPIMPNAYLPC